jgi:hypothetical protein
MPRHLTRTLDERNDKIDSSDGGSRGGIVVLQVEVLIEFSVPLSSK